MKQGIMLFLIMLFLIWLAFVVGMIVGARTHGYTSQAPHTPSVAVTAPERQITLDDLLAAIEQVESGGDANAVGDGGKAVGAYQIHKIYVDDVNRIIGQNFYKYEDRWNRKRSRDMAKVYLTHWEPRYLEPKPNIVIAEHLARIHNGGPNGWKKDCTKKYWIKVKAVLYE